MLQQDEQVVLSRAGDIRQAQAADRLNWAMDGSYDRSCLGTQRPMTLEGHIPRNWSGNGRQSASTVLTAREAHVEYRPPFELHVRLRATPSTGDLLRVIETWPHLTWNLHLEALKILYVEGVASLVRRGGQHAENGGLTFSRASSKVPEIVCRLLGLSPGFWDIDDSGASWAVCPHPIAPERGPWLAWAISFDRYQELPDAPARESAGQKLGDSCGEFGSISQFSRSEEFIRRNVPNLQRALDLAGVLVAGANDDGECIVELNDNIPSGIGDSSASRHLIGALSELSRLPIALFNLLPDRDGGWMKRRSQAVTYFEVLDDQRVMVRISLDLGPTLQQFRSAFPAL